VLIPAVVEELSGEALLVMELVEGIKVTDLDGLAAAGIDRRAVARLLNDVYAEQMLRRGVLHGDPHPGNLLVQPGPRLVLLDHGLTVELAPGLVDALRRLVRALAALDFEALAEALAAVGVAPGDAGATLPLLQLAGALGAERLALSSSWRLLGSALGRLSEDLVLIGRALALLDGITQTLDRELDTMAIVRQYA
jgi:ubiquinone biosynthesis protein